MDPITEKLSQLQELSHEELAELEEHVLNEFSATEEQELTTDSVSKLTQLADSVEAIRTEQARRTAEAAALEEAAAEAASRIKGATASEENESEAAGNDMLDEDEESEVPESPVVDEEEEEEEVITASSEASESEEVSEPEAEASNEEESQETPEESEASVEEESTEEASVEEAEEASNESEEDSEASVEVAEESEASLEEDSNDSEASAEEPAEAEAAVEEDADSEASVETPEEAEASVEEETETNTEATVTAASNGNEGSLNIEPPADRKPQVKPAAQLTITAGADIPGYTAGTKLNNTLEVAEAFQKRLHSLRNVHGGDGEQHIVASFNQEFPEDRFLTANDPLENIARIEGVTSPEAITAAAGVCLPLETRYDLGCDVGVTDRPVRDALARFGADRGGIRFFTAPSLDDGFEAATGFWRGDGSDPNGGDFHTYESDRTTATTPADAKPCLEVQCVAEETAYIEAVTLCLTFNNLTTRTFPELIKRQNELAMVAHARAAENALLAQIEAGSTAITAQTQVVGATREILNLFDRAVAAYRYRHRMNNTTPLRAIVPIWVKNLLRSDLALQMPGDGMEVLDLAESRIEAWFRSRGVNVAWHLDGATGPATVDVDGDPSTDDTGFAFPSTIEFGLFAEGSWLFLDGGTLDIGVIRDSSLVATNQYKEFVETFEGVANVGCDSFWVSAAYEPCGSAAALVETCPAV